MCLCESQLTPKYKVQPFVPMSSCMQHMVFSDRRNTPIFMLHRLLMLVYRSPNSLKSLFWHMIFILFCFNDSAMLTGTVGLLSSWFRYVGFWYWFVLFIFPWRVGIVYTATCARKKYSECFSGCLYKILDFFSVEELLNLCTQMSDAGPSNTPYMLRVGQLL